MPDNVLANAGSGGATFATDADDGQSPAVHYPITKLAFGALNTFTLVSTSNGLPVAQQGAWNVTNAGTFATQAAQSGTWNVTNVSGTVSLPTGASTSAKQPALGTAGTASADVITVQGIASMTALKVDGSAVTQPVSAASLPLPSGASTAAKQPALGTAGTASADVITVQGITSMTALKVDGSAVTQPVSIASAIGVTDNSGSLTVDNAGTFVVQDSQVVADNAGFTDGTTKVFAAGYVFDEVAGTALTENDAAAARIDSKRAQVYVLEDATTRGQRVSVSAGGALKVDASGAAVPITDNSGSLTVDNGGTFAVQAAQSGTWNVTNISGTVSLPTGASTAAKQPALGTAGTASSDVLTVQGIASMTALKVDGSAVTQPVSGTVTVTQSTASSLKVDLSGTAANATALKVDGSAVTQPVSVAATVTVADTPSTSGGLSMHQLVSAASNNATSVKASAGQVYSVALFNNTANVAYFKLYNKASAPAPASDTPLQTYLIPASGGTNGSGVVIDIDKGLAFGTGIAYAVVGGAGVTDNTSVAASAFIVSLGYK